MGDGKLLLLLLPPFALAVVGEAGYEAARGGIGDGDALLFTNVVLVLVPLPPFEMSMFLSCFF